jgi:hypothetical protein
MDGYMGAEFECNASKCYVYDCWFGSTIVYPCVAQFRRLWPYSEGNSTVVIYLRSLLDITRTNVRGAAKLHNKEES